MASQNEVKLITGIVYMLECKDPSIKDFYIGGTIRTFSERRGGHKKTCNDKKSSNYNHYKYKFIRDNGGWHNWRMTVIEYIEVEDELDLRMFEQLWLDTLNPTLNKNKAYNPNVKKIEIKHCSNCDKTYTRCNKKRHLRSSYCKNYNDTTSESSSESIINSDSDTE